MEGLSTVLAVGSEGVPCYGLLCYKLLNPLSAMNRHVPVGAPYKQCVGHLWVSACIFH